MKNGSESELIVGEVQNAQSVKSQGQQHDDNLVSESKEILAISIEAKVEEKREQRLKWDFVKQPEGIE